MIILVQGNREVLMDDEDGAKIAGLTLTVVGTGYVLTYHGAFSFHSSRGNM